MNEKQVSLCGAVLDRHRHICAFFNSKEEEYRVLLPFIQEGLEQDDRAFHIVDARHRQERLRRLEEAGVDLAEAERQGKVEVRVWEEAYLRNGQFDQNAMLALIEEILQSGKASHGLTRLWANMEWALENRPGVDDIVEYESRLNYVLPKYDDAVVCTYDLAKFSAPVVMDILRTHPMVIIGGILQENPFFVPPDELLKELRERRGRPAH
jgi:HEPN domain-containing protein